MPRPAYYMGESDCTLDPKLGSITQSDDTHLESPASDAHNADLHRSFGHLEATTWFDDTDPVLFLSAAHRSASPFAQALCVGCRGLFTNLVKVVHHDTGYGHHPAFRSWALLQESAKSCSCCHFMFDALERRFKIRLEDANSLGYFSGARPIRIGRLYSEYQTILRLQCRRT